MTIFLHGPDEYRREQKKKYWIDEFKKKHSGLSMEYFDLEKPEELDALREFAHSQSIFKEKKLAIVGNLYEADEKIAAKALPAIVAKKATIILFSEKKSPNKALQFLLEKPAVVEEFEHLAGPAWEAFIKQEAKKLGTVLAPDAAKFLAEVYQNNSWALMTELEKISNLKKGPVEKNDLEDFDLEIAPNYWGLVNGVKSGELRSRLFALEKLFATNDPPPKIFNILASQWQQKLPQMAEYDLKIKSGKLEYEEALLDLVL